MCHTKINYKARSFSLLLLILFGIIAKYEKYEKYLAKTNVQQFGKIKTIFFLHIFICCFFSSRYLRSWEVILHRPIYLQTLTRPQTFLLRITERPKNKIVEICCMKKFLLNLSKIKLCKAKYCFIYFH